MSFEWLLYEKDNYSWTKVIDILNCDSYFQDNPWMNVLVNQGWILKRWVCVENERVVAAVQTFVKLYPFNIGVVWAPEWIIGDYQYGSNFRSALSNNLELSKLYFRFRSSNIYNEEEQMLLLSQGWIKPLKKIDSGLTMTLNLNKPIKDIEESTSKNWRRNLKRSRRLDEEFCKIDDPEIIISVYKELNNLKNISAGYSEEEIRSIFKFFKDQLIVFGVIDGSGNYTAIRGAIIYKNTAFDIFAATTKKARKVYSSYKLFIYLLSRCKSMGCSSYDLSGIDPINNIGVYNFKKGTGAKAVNQLGEFEYANSKLLLKLIWL